MGDAIKKHQSLLKFKKNSFGLKKSISFEPLIKKIHFPNQSLIMLPGFLEIRCQK